MSPSQPPPEYRVIGITGIPEVYPGDDLVKTLVEASAEQGTPLEQGDLLVVTQKVVSKAEGRLIVLDSVTPSEFACKVAKEHQKDARLVELVLRESRRIVRMDRGVIITETREGFICANAGIDTSNLEGQGSVALLPESSDRSAQGIRDGVRRLTGATVPVIISDTFGRPWRHGCTNVAIGIAGMPALIDYRGQRDPSGFLFRASVLAVADELASATEPIMGKVDRIPAAIVRGYVYPKGKGSSASLVRDAEQDLFR